LFRRTGEGTGLYEVFSFIGQGDREPSLPGTARWTIFLPTS
jgi:hypothetical protein